MTSTNIEVPVPVAVTEHETTAPTMSSLEIADLTGKEHKHVLRDIRKLVEQLYGFSPNLDSPDIKGVFSELNAVNGLTEVVHLDRYHTEVLVTGYDVKRRAAVIKRWYDLETGQADAAHLQNQMTEAQALDSAKTILRREINIFRDHIHSDLESNLFTFQKVTNELNKSGQYKRKLKQSSTYAMAVNAGWITGDHQNTRKRGEFFVRRDIMPTGGRTSASFRLKLTRLGRAKLLQPDLDEATLIRDYLMHLPSNIQHVPGVRKIEIVNHMIAEWEKQNWEPVDFPIDPLKKLAGHLDGSTRLLG